VDALAAAAFLYLGAGTFALGARAWRSRARREAAVTRSDVPRVLLVAVLGGIAGPALLVHGLATTNAIRASLLLTLEAPFTVILAAAFFGEHVSRRVWFAATFITAGAALLARPGPGAGGAGVVTGGATLGDLFVGFACLAWALDNTVSRGLADRDPLAVVAAKGLVGGALSLAVTALVHPASIQAGTVARLLLLGAMGYGLSLQLYLRAQRVVGAARTASVFATAPFVGVVVAVLAGAPWPGLGLAVSAGLMAVGIWLHVTERHRHAHTHGPIEHDHAHQHDDGHHGHSHEPMPVGPHAHFHRHEAVTHDHEHVEDVHHAHTH
jgi:drug/metabolite transporter (DMT)-like permease